MLIGTRSDRRMSSQSYDAALARLFAPRRPTQNLIRKAYINHWHRARVLDRELSEGQKEAIADRMRHSLATATAAYRKVNAPA